MTDNSTDGVLLLSKSTSSAMAPRQQTPP